MFGCMPRFDQTLAALADPSRCKLLYRLAENPCRAGALTEGFTINRPVICKSTRLLIKPGQIKARKIGGERIDELVLNSGAKQSRRSSWSSKKSDGSGISPLKPSNVSRRTRR